MRRVTLGDVVRKCFRQKEFFEKLVRNPKSALRNAKIELSPRDMRKLKNRLRNRDIKVDAIKLIRMGIKAAVVPVPPPWNPFRVIRKRVRG